MAKIQRLSADQRLNLVAYLDGELNDDETQEIEKILAENPIARHDLEIFTRTWELLDELPRIEPSEGFTERTLATLTVDEAYQPLGQRPWFRKMKRVVGWTAVLILLLAGGAAGFMGTYVWMPEDSDQLIEHLPVVENIELYEAVGDVEFLTLVSELGRLTPLPGSQPSEAPPPDDESDTK